jgi:hypothetical protein
MSLISTLSILVLPHVPVERYHILRRTHQTFCYGHPPKDCSGNYSGELPRAPLLQGSVNKVALRRLRGGSSEAQQFRAHHALRSIRLVKDQ